MKATPLPLTIERSDSEVAITWDRSHVSRYSARALRLECRCASCREEMTGRLLLNHGEVPAEIRAVHVNLVGTYAIGISFSDGHSTGIYTWELLLSLCSCPQCTGRVER